ncbi:DUF1630-domain-containing protein [Terfezia boudieri ATCC MYA-4762]|uniref:DUF1630-domain-containing protein n=1 Tax=Terfezia boudieri ATCC MYA-4762 TaxID=1051890 RepID=A0A3N4LS45_9PEZI|nr:DUF1630-domain-containing protein [Terfezia boudieri ATCC MYA-4762]
MAEEQHHDESSSSSVFLDYNFSIEALRRWIVAFVVCDFNVDVGVEVEYMLPPTPEISTSDLSTICFNSFPERNSDTVGDVEFHFRFRHSSSELVLEADHDKDAAYWYGFCLFRQQKDITVKRHFRQKSLVLISQHNYATLFRHLVKTVALIDFDVSPTIVESACANIASWNPPEIGHQELPFLGSLLKVHIPPHVAFPLQGLASPSMPSKLDLTLEHSKEIYTSEPLGSWAKLIALLPSPAELYVIFEQALLCEPMVILADEPSICSEFVSCVVDFIRPIPYSGDFRPYLTLQSDFFTNVDEGVSVQLAHTLTKFPGVTNPFFLKRLLQTQGKASNPAHVVYLAPKETRRNHQSRSFYPFTTDVELPPGFMPNETKGHIGKDWRFIKKLEEYLRGNEMSARDCSDMIRRHFSILSALFLAPLNRYLATILKTTNSSGISSYAPFSEDEFLASLWKHGCYMGFKGKTGFHRHKNAEAFYRRFYRSKNFESWLGMKLEMRNAQDMQNGSREVE